MEDSGLALGIPKAWQSIVTGWRSVNVDFKRLGEKRAGKKGLGT